MAVRVGLITRSAMNNIERASKIIMKDVLEDGGSRTDAIKFIKRLVFRGTKQVR